MSELIDSLERFHKIITENRQIITRQKIPLSAD